MLISSSTPTHVNKVVILRLSPEKRTANEIHQKNSTTSGIQRRNHVIPSVLNQLG